MTAAPTSAHTWVRRPIRWDGGFEERHADLARRLEDRVATLASTTGIEAGEVFALPEALARPLYHRLSDHFMARNAPRLRLRSSDEEAVANALGPDVLHGALRSRDRFLSLLREINRRSLGNGSAFLRTTAITTALDRAGSWVQFPAPSQVVRQLGILRRLLVHHHEDRPGLSCILAFLYVTNAHPFPDGNGRTARILANLILRATRPQCPYVPWSEIFQMSRGGYEIRLRAAETMGDTASFVRFIAGCASILGQLGDRTASTRAG